MRLLHNNMETCKTRIMFQNINAKEVFQGFSRVKKTQFAINKSFNFLKQQVNLIIINSKTKLQKSKLYKSKKVMQIEESIQQKINIEDNKQSIQYYEYLRSITQINQLSYWIGNPSVQIISGKILLESFSPINVKQQPQNFELYLKQIQKANTYQSSINISQIPGSQTQSDDKQDQQSPQKIKRSPSKSVKSRCLVLCGIPNSKSPVQVMQAECISRNSNLIKEIRVIKTVHIRYYGMLLLMKDEQSGSQFFNDLFGSKYMELQMQRIIIRQVKSITLTFSELNIVQGGGNNEMNLLRSIKQDSQFISPQNIFMTFHHQKLKQKIENSEMDSENFNSLVCAICFQQCSRYTISILCGHYFHLQCLEKWSENICPLCRYHQQPPIIKFCEKCNQCEGLWVCLICGFRLCCGANNDILGDDSHIYDHYKTTSHSLSMQLETKFLFDAKIPAFLHQKFYRDLIQNRDEENLMMKQKNIEENNKKDKITLQIQQYQLQVSEQMKRQRLYFQQQINKNVKDHRLILTKKREKIQSIRSQIQRMDSEQKQYLKQVKQSEQVTLKKNKQLEIIKGLIKMKEQKVQQKKLKFNQNQKLKVFKLKQLESQIKEKRQQILNYRKNIQLRQKWSEKLKGEEIAGEFVLNQKGDQKKQHKKKKNSIKKA